jgi:hypothetical protein
MIVWYINPRSLSLYHRCRRLPLYRQDSHISTLVGGGCDLSAWQIIQADFGEISLSTMPYWIWHLRKISSLFDYALLVFRNAAYVISGPVPASYWGRVTVLWTASPSLARKIPCKYLQYWWRCHLGLSCWWLTLEWSKPDTANWLRWAACLSANSRACLENGIGVFA